MGTPGGGGGGEEKERERERERGVGSEEGRDEEKERNISMIIWPFKQTSVIKLKTNDGLQRERLFLIRHFKTTPSFHVCLDFVSERWWSVLALYFSFSV